jgi:hypothetical protein
MIKCPNACLLFAGWLLLAPSTVFAQTVYQGADPGVAAGSPRPNSDAAAANFHAGANPLGQISTMRFESLATGTLLSGALEFGVSMTSTGQDAACPEQGISSGSSVTTGYNTTPGGTNFLGFCPIFDVGTSSMTFAFPKPVSGFGTYITGLGTANGNLSVEFNDGSSRSYSVTGSDSGGVQFFGITDPGRTIAAVTFQMTGVTSGSRDIFGLDDFSFATPINIVQVPTLNPFVLLLASLSLAFLAGFVLRRR